LFSNGLTACVSDQWSVHSGLAASVSLITAGCASLSQPIYITWKLLGWGFGGGRDTRLLWSEMVEIENILPFTPNK